MMLEKFERYPLMFGPTPIERLGRLSEALGGEVEIWAKCDDCNSGLAFGGNKIRKLEYIIPDAIASNAGMLVGFAKDGRACKVIGIDASATPGQTRAQVLEIARNTADLVELGREITEDDVVLNEDYAYPAYGIPSPETNDAIRLCARTEGMMTDPVYEGKSMQGLIDLFRKGFFPAGSKVLYAHLGGVPAINAYSYVYRNG